MKSYTASYKALGHKDYGSTYSKEGTSFRVWSPKAEQLSVALYEEWNDFYREVFPMNFDSDGTWQIFLPGDLKGKYYTYLLKLPEEDRLFEILDPWAKASAPNSLKNLIVDLAETDPPGFREHLKPKPVAPGEMILYELHVRDFTVSSDSGVTETLRGKYLGLAQTGTSLEGHATGLDHLVELGVTHVHLMPVSDFKTVDELRPTDYNWGYDPVQFSVPEGSFATSAHGWERIRELKTLIQTIHEKGMRVVLDVVYNHTFYNEESNLNRLAPAYFYRTRNGVFTDGSGCGNELAIGKPMVNKFVIDSLKYWMDEFKVDGFRFDLLGLYDIEAVADIVKATRKRDAAVLLYGEPWVGGHSGLMHKRQFLKGCQRGTGMAVFNDEFRDAIKGDNDGWGKGLVNGNGQTLQNIRKGILGEIAYNRNLQGFADEPAEIVNYICAHDNLILRDKIERVTEGASEEYRIKCNRLAFTLMLTAFGTPFIHEGTEFYRTKCHDHNSYKSSDYVNQVVWRNKVQYADLFQYIRALIAFRKQTGIFDMTAEAIKKCVKFQDVDGVSYTIDHNQIHYHFFHNFFDVPIKRQVPKGALVYFWNDEFVDGGRRMETRRMLDVEGKCSLIYSVPFSADC